MQKGNRGGPTFDQVRISIHFKMHTGQKHQQPHKASGTQTSAQKCF